MKMRASAILLLLASPFVWATDDPDLPVIRISAERFHFSPSQIRLKEGDEVILELTSEDTIHGFRVGAADLNVIIPARGRGRTRVLFRAHKEGRYPFECSRACGAGHIMMRGMIVVE